MTGHPINRPKTCMFRLMGESELPQVVVVDC